MNIEHFLSELKKDYEGINPSQKQVEESWQELEAFIKPEPYKVIPIVTFRFRKRLSVALCTLLILVAGGVAATSRVQAALPGEPLYPVKRLSENVFVAVSGNTQYKAEQRAQEIVDLSKKDIQDKSRLEETVEEYKQTLSETKESVSESAKSEEKFDETLKEHEEKFQEVMNEREESEQLRKALEAVREARKEKIDQIKDKIKGATTEQRENSKDKENNKNEDIKKEKNKEQQKSRD